MAVAVRGRLPVDPKQAFQEIQERLIALERDSRTDVQAGFTNPGVPGFGPGLPGVIGGGGGSVPIPPPTSTTIIITQPASVIDLFLLMGS